MTTKQAADIIRMLLGYLKGEIEPPKQETIEEAKAFEQQGYECLEMAIKALEQQPCEDAISRKDMLAVFRQSNSLSQAWNGFEKLPPVTPKEKTGHWEYVQYDYNPNIGNWHCSECRSIVIMCVNKKETGGTLYKYCPNCGARMVEQQEKSEYEHDHEVVKAYNDGQAFILDKIRAEIEEKMNTEISKHYDEESLMYHSFGLSDGLKDVLDIIDKYREVSE